MNPSISTTREWLETDGLGGFASGTLAGLRTRRYHALLLTGQHGPTGRQVLVNGCDASVVTAAGEFPISAQQYLPDVISPDGASRVREFRSEPWPTWVFALEDGTLVSQEIFIPHGLQATVLVWKLVSEKAAATLRVRPFLSGRDYHSMHHENDSFPFDAIVEVGQVRWQSYPGVPSVHAFTNGAYAADPQWYRNFLYVAERDRGLDCTEDLAAPGVFTFDLARGEAVLIFAHANAAMRLAEQGLPASALASLLRTVEDRRRQMFPTPLHRAADQYLVRRGAEQTIVAGYPWFTDWGRDTFIALRGLCIAVGRLEEARSILLSWAGAISEGMLPNRFPDHGEQPEFNSVDASLWFIIAVHDFLMTAVKRGFPVDARQREFLQRAVETIVEGYSRGTRHRIKMDDDGLLASGEPGVQLTWMDAKVGDWVVTPRIGKPVEVQALWINALWIASQSNASRWQSRFEKARATFAARYWNEAAGGLFDVIDVDHVSGRVDDAVRPNQIYALGGLPLALLEGEQAGRVLATVESQLLTPMGLRSLAPAASGYRPHYGGGVWERDSAYHQGTVWPFLMGAFVEAWLRVHGATPENIHVARERFVAPLRAHLGEAGVGHVSEIADADAPHVPRGCPWQAWSLGELLRLEHTVLGTAPAPKSTLPRTSVDAPVMSDALSSLVPV